MAVFALQHLEPDALFRGTPKGLYSQPMKPRAASRGSVRENIRAKRIAQSLLQMFSTFLCDEALYILMR